MTHEDCAAQVVLMLKGRRRVMQDDAAWEVWAKQFVTAPNHGLDTAEQLAVLNQARDGGR